MWSLRVWSALLTFPIANSLMWEAFLCILEYLAAPLAFTSQMPVAAPQSWQSVMSADIVKCSPESWNPPGWEPLIWGHQSLPVLPHASWDYPSVFLPRWASFLFLLPPLSFNFYLTLWELPKTFIWRNYVRAPLPPTTVDPHQNTESKRGWRLDSSCPSPTRHCVAMQSTNCTKFPGVLFITLWHAIYKWIM